MTAPHTPNRSALSRLARRTALTYAIAGFVWILFSDLALEYLVPDRALAGRLSMVKGWVFVSVTALMLYLLLRRRLTSWDKEVGARSQAEAEAREHQALYHSLVESMPAGIFRKDASGRYVYANPWLCQFNGLKPEDYLGKTALQVAEAIMERGTRTVDAATGSSIYNQGGGHHEKIMQSGERVQIEEDWIMADGRKYCLKVTKTPIMDASGKVVGSQGILFDITEHRRFEEHLRRSQRLEAVGALASGIAHDLNNILAPVLMAPALLKETVRTEQERELLELIEQSAQRASAVVKQLLTFSRGSGGERLPLHVKHLVREMRGIASETFPRNITLRSIVAPGLQPVLGDATQIHQVLLNLCVNARDAMPDGGTLTLCCENTLVDEELARVNPPAKPGRYIMIRVTDTGQGMPPEIVERIFDPFFTTKEVGKGTGLGLSTVLGIVRSHGGFLTVESELCHGSTFRAYLPAAPAEQPVPSVVTATRAPRGQNELILIVDDEPSIGESTRVVLERSGYRAIAATSGNEALEIFRLHDGEISLVITDVMMPVMDGIAMLRKMRDIRPDIRAVVTTGMASETKQNELAELGITEALMKPCDRSELLEAVHSALTN